MHTPQLFKVQHLSLNSWARLTWRSRIRTEVAETWAQVFFSRWVTTFWPWGQQTGKEINIWSHCSDICRNPFVRTWNIMMREQRSFLATSCHTCAQWWLSAGLTLGFLISSHLLQCVYQGKPLEVLTIKIGGISVLARASRTICNIHNLKPEQIHNRRNITVVVNKTQDLTISFSLPTTAGVRKNKAFPVTRWHKLVLLWENKLASAFMKNIKALIQVKACSDIPEFVPLHTNILAVSRGITMEKHTKKDKIPNLGKKMADGTVSSSHCFFIFSSLKS